MESSFLQPTATAPLALSTAIKTLLLTDLVDSTRLQDRLGDERAYELALRHDRMTRALLNRYRCREIDKTDGFLLLFDRPLDAVELALAYHRALVELGAELGVELRARVGIHLGEVYLYENEAGDVARGAKPLEVEGIAKSMTARLVSLAGGGQTLLTRTAFDLARRSTVGTGGAVANTSWLAHGAYLLKGVDEPVEIFEIGVAGIAPLAAPPDSEKARRAVKAGDELTLGWRPAPGQEIPRRPNWQLVERLSEGGFGEVWLAEQKQTGEQRVFKFCYEVERLRSLQREVKLFCLLKETLGSRDDIARVLDWSFEEAPYFLESEYTEGGSLVEWAEERGGLCNVPLAERLELVAQVAEALAAAHSVGVLHKDVKPANVLVTEVDGRPRAQLTDFGISEVMAESVLAGQGITVLNPTHAVTGGGTHLYMAPELIEGKVPTIQADVYALGVVLYQAVVGDFTRALAPGWRRDVEDEILVEDIAQTVDRSPERRPASGLEVASRLRRLETRRAEARARRERARAEERRKFFALFGAAATLILVVVSVLAVQAVTARRDAELRREQAEDLISYMLGDLQKKLDEVGRLDILNDVGEKAQQYFAAIPDDDLTDREVFRRSEALSQIGRVRLAEARPEAAMAAFREALERGEELAARDPRNLEWQLALAERHFWIGKILWDQGDLDGALAEFQEQLRITEELIVAHPDNADLRVNAAFAQTNLGFVQRARGDLEGALAAFGSALETKRLLASDSPDDVGLQLGLARQHNTVGLVLMELGRLDESLRNFQADLEIVRHVTSQEPANNTYRAHLATSHNYVGYLLAARGNRDRALQHFRAQLEIAAELVAVDSGQSSWQELLGVAHRRVGRELLLRGELRQAREQTEQGLAILETLAARDPTQTKWQLNLANGYRSVGEVAVASGRNDAAVERARQAIATLEPLVARSPESRNYLSLGESYVLLARALDAAGDGDAARAAWKRSAAELEPYAKSSSDFSFLAPWAEALSHLDRTAEAEQARQRLSAIGYQYPWS